MTTSRAPRVLFVFIALLASTAGVGLAQTQNDLAGTWGSNIGVTYTITQNGAQYRWQDPAGVQGTIAFTATGLVTTWTDASGPHTADGVVAARDAQGRPSRITWSNGVVFERAAAPAAMATITQMIPVAPAAIGGAPVPTAGSLPCQPPPIPAILQAFRAESPPNSLVMALGIPTITGILPGGLARIQDFAFGSTNETAGQGSETGGASAARVTMAPLTIKKPVDLTSPAVAHQHFVGKILGDVSILVVDPSATRVIAQWQLDAVVITSHRLSFESASGPAASSAAEEIGLHVGRIRLRTFRYDAQSGLVQCAEVVYDAVTNTVG